MKQALHSSKYLKERGGWWHYIRRVPKRYAAVDDRGWIQVALRTQSLEVAMMRRDALAEADGALWNARSLEFSGGDPARQAWKMADHRYQAAVSRAMAMGFVYRPVHELAALPDIDEIVERLQAADKGKAPTEA